MLKGHDKKIESLAFHTAASQILASAGGSELKVWDLNSGSAKFSVAFPDVVHSISWKSDGSLLTATCKDKKIRTVDPRTGTFAQEVDGHTGVKASISTWLGDLEQLLSTGFNKVHPASPSLPRSALMTAFFPPPFNSRPGKGSTFCGIPVTW